MRKRNSASAMACALALCLVVAACGDDDDSGPAPANTPTPRPTNTASAPTATRTSGTAGTPTATRTGAPVATATPTPRPTNTASAPTATRTSGTAATPTATQTGAPVATATPTVQGEATATPGEGPDLDTVEVVVAGILPAVAGLAEFGNLSGGSAAIGNGGILPLPPITVPCPNGGTLTFSCSDRTGGSTIDIEFDQCVVVDPGVTRSTINGDFSQDSPATCLNPVPPANATLTILFDGSVSVVDLETNEQFDVTEDVTMVVKLEASGAVRLSIEGTVSEACVGTVELETPVEVFLPADGDCPTAGEVRMTLSSGAALVRYTSTGGVEIDLGDDGSVDESYTTCDIEVPDIC